MTCYPFSMEPENLPSIVTSYPDNPIPPAPAAPQPPSPSKKQMSGIVALLIFIGAVTLIFGGYVVFQNLNSILTPSGSPSGGASPTPESHGLSQILPTIPRITPTIKPPTPTVPVAPASQAELQTHDNIRVSDLKRLSEALTTYIQKNGTEKLPAARVDSQNAGHVRSQGCAVNWTGANLCDYLQDVPVDVVNSKSVQAINEIGDAYAETAGYGLIVEKSSGTFELCTFLESEASVSILAGDNGNDPDLYETGTNTKLECDAQPF